MSDKKSYSPTKGPQQGGFKRFLWNPDTKEFLGRTGGSWFKITIFYIIFFAGLAAFFGLMLWVFYQTLDPNKPKWTLEQGLIGTNPGVGFRPMPDQEKNVESTLIWYKRGNAGDWKYWSDELAKFWKEYDSQTRSAGSSSTDTCSWGSGASKDKFCQVELTKMEGCTENNNFGYEQGEPCVLIKLNRIYDWKPDPYTSLDLANPNNIPKEMPQSLINEINATNPAETYVWFSCRGENPADEENLGGDIRYYPKQGIPTYYFPYVYQNGYLSPFIFVRFNPLNGVLINVECTAWAKNIAPNRQDRVGKVHFELMID